MGGLYEKEICGFSTHYCPKRKVIPNTPIIGAVKWCRLLTAWSKLRRNTIATINVTYAKVFPHDKSASFDIDYVRVYQNINYEKHIAPSIDGKPYSQDNNFESAYDSPFDTAN